MRALKRFSNCMSKALNDTIVTHDGIEHAGYLSFLALLSLFPFLVFLLAFVGFIGQSDLGVRFVGLIMENAIIPGDIRSALEPRLAEIISGPPQGLLTFAILGAIWTASSAVEGLRTILNRAYRVNTPPAYIWRRILSIIQFLMLTLAVVLAMVGLVVVPLAWDYVEHWLHLEGLYNNPLWNSLRYGFSTLILFLVVCALYVIIPNIKQRWQRAAPGATLVVLLWIGSGMLLSAYLRHFEQVHLIYGSLGGTIATLLFFYISAIIFVFGAEFNYHLERSYGNVIQEREKVGMKRWRFQTRAKRQEHNRARKFLRRSTKRRNTKV